MISLITKLLKFARYMAKCVLIAAVFLLILETILIVGGLKVWKISGISMMPTLSDGSSSLTCSYTPINRGDIVTVRSPIEDGAFWVKRVIGIPGDRIFISGNYLEVNGEPDLISQKFKYSSIDIQNETNIMLLDGEYFIAGDNRRLSYDSRYVGPVKEDSIVGEQLLNF